MRLIVYCNLMLRLLSKLKLTFAALSMALFTLSALAGGDVYIVPFQIETYEPITRATIISQAQKKWTVSSKRKISRLVELLSDGEKGSFDEDRVRGVVLCKGQTYFLDANGVVSKNGGPGIKINKEEFIKFLDSLDDDPRIRLKRGALGSSLAK